MRPICLCLFAPAWRWKSLGLSAWAGNVGARLYGDSEADKGGDYMAKNTGKGSRRGAVKNRSEFKHPNGTYVKRDTETGRIMNVSKNPHKGVRDEN